MGRYFNDQGDPNYYKRKQESDEEAGSYSLNVQEAYKEKMIQRTGRYGQSQNLFGQGNYGYNPFGAGYEAYECPTSNPTWPRALVMGYNQATRTLVVIFRDKKWIRYDDEVPPDFWQALKDADSTGKVLSGLGIDNLPWTQISGAGDLPRKPKQQAQYGMEEGL